MPANIDISNTMPGDNSASYILKQNKQAKAMEGAVLLETIAEEQQKQMEQNKPPVNEDKLKDRAQIQNTSNEDIKTNSPLLDKPWTALDEELAWKKILECNLLQIKDMESALKLLQAIYQELLHAILENTTGQPQSLQLTKLEEILFHKINEIMHNHLNELATFLSYYTTPNTKVSIAASLYQIITGNSPSKALYVKANDILNKAEPLYPQAAPKQTTLEPEFAKKNMPFANEGIIYKRTTDGVIQIQKKEELFAVSKDPDAASFSPEKESILKTNHIVKTALYSRNDLEQSVKFIRYLENGQAFPLSLDTSSVSCEEVLGFQAALLSIKSSVFSHHSGVKKEMSNVLKSAIDQFIILYLVDAGKKAKADACNKLWMKSTLSNMFNHEDVLKVYNYTISIYQKTNDHKNALLQGMRYAFERYEMKAENEEKSLHNEGEKKAFFSETTLDAKISQLKDGIAFLKTNWNKFIEAMDFKDSEGTEFSEDINHLSLWGAVYENICDSKEAVKMSSFSDIIFWTGCLLFVSCIFMLIMSGRTQDTVSFLFIGSLLFILLLVLKTKNKKGR